jgi:hypothetical protein
VDSACEAKVALRALAEGAPTTRIREAFMFISPVTFLDTIVRSTAIFFILCETTAVRIPHSTPSNEGFLVPPAAEDPR